MDQRRGLQRVPDPLPVELPLGLSLEFLIDEGDQLVAGDWVASRKVLQ